MSERRFIDYEAIELEAPKGDRLSLVEARSLAGFAHEEVVEVLLVLFYIKFKTSKHIVYVIFYVVIDRHNTYVLGLYKSLFVILDKFSCAESINYYYISKISALLIVQYIISVNSQVLFILADENRKPCDVCSIDPLCLINK